MMIRLHRPADRGTGQAARRGGQGRREACSIEGRISGLCGPAEIRKHPFIFAMFFRGASGGLSRTAFGKINPFLLQVASLMKGRYGY
jgi:hypothetical protein